MVVLTLYIVSLLMCLMGFKGAGSALAAILTFMIISALGYIIPVLILFVVISWIRIK